MWITSIKTYGHRISKWYSDGEKITLRIKEAKLYSSKIDEGENWISDLNEITITINKYESKEKTNE